ncbi:MAG: hypothetical protein ACRC6B_11895 [Fusobacteriaceae bacterium]
MIRLSSVPVEVYQACSMYVLETGNEVYVNDIMIGADAKAFLHSFTRVKGELKITPVYLTADIHSTALKRCQKDIATVNEYMKAKVEEAPDV